MDKFDLTLSLCYNTHVQINDIIEYWVRGADEDYKTAKALLAAKRNAHSLFFCHLAIEKYLKALVVKKTEKNAPFNHNLAFLSSETGIVFSPDQLTLLDKINTFNIRARYDDFKFKFHQKATKEYTEEYFNLTTELFLWLQKQIKN